MYLDTQDVLTIVVNLAAAGLLALCGWIIRKHVSQVDKSIAFRALVDQVSEGTAGVPTANATAEDAVVLQRIIQLHETVKTLEQGNQLLVEMATSKGAETVIQQWRESLNQDSDVEIAELLPPLLPQDKDSEVALLKSQTKKISTDLSVLHATESLSSPLKNIWFALSENNGKRLLAVYNTRPRAPAHYQGDIGGLEKLQFDYRDLASKIQDAVPKLVPRMSIVVSRGSVSDLTTLVFAEGNEELESEVAKSIGVTIHAIVERPGMLDRASTGYALSDGKSIPGVDANLYTVFKAEVACRQQLGLNDYSRSGWLSRQLKRWGIKDTDKQWKNFEMIGAVLSGTRRQDPYQGVVVVYQPKYTFDHASNRWQLYGAEALLRYQMPEQSVLLPAFPIIASLRAMGKMADCTTKILIPTVNDFVQDLKSRGLVRPDFRISINVEPGDLSNEFARQIETAYDHKPGSIELELLEEGVPHKEMSVALELLRTRVPIALDDFGDKLANIERILTLKPIFVKLDIKVVSSCLKNNQLTFLKGLALALQGQDIRDHQNEIRFSMNDKPRVVAEGVDTIEGLRVIRDVVGIDKVQGFIFSEPVTASEFIKICERHSTVDDKADTLPFDDIVPADPRD